MKRVLNEGAVTDIRRALAAETEATVAGMLDPETTPPHAVRLLTRCGERARTRKTARRP